MKKHNEIKTEECLWRDIGNLEAINSIPSMMVKDGLLYLHWLSREYYKGVGEIVDGGPLLGSSTVSLASGLNKNGTVSLKNKRIHSYDLFKYAPYMDNMLQKYSYRHNFKPGDSFLPVYLENIRNYRDYVEVNSGNILEKHWEGKPIEILFIDIAKSWEIHNHVIKEFFGCLIPNRSIVIHQDYCWWACYWIHLTMQYLSPYFRVIHAPYGPTLSFINTKEIPKELIEADYSKLFNKEQAIELMDKAIFPLQGNCKLSVMLAKVRLLTEYREYERACSLAEEVQNFPNLGEGILRQLALVRNHIPAEFIQAKFTIENLKNKKEAYGALIKTKSQQIQSLKKEKTENLILELLYRLSGGETISNSKIASLAGVLYYELLEKADNHSNRFSFLRLRENFNFIYNHLKKYDMNFKNATIVNAGCGSLNPFGILFIFLCIGAKKCIAIDLDNINNKKLATKHLNHLFGFLLEDPASIIGDYPIDRRNILDNISSSFDLSKIRKGDWNGINQNRLKFIQEPIHQTSLKSSSIDVVFSTSFLEHLPAVEETAKELYRIIKPGGLQVHRVDMVDHRIYYSKQTDPLAFLTEKEGEEIVYGTNRLRFSQLKDIFLRVGFKVLEAKSIKIIPIDQKIRENFVEPFRSMDLEEVKIGLAEYVLKKPIF